MADRASHGGPGLVDDRLRAMQANLEALMAQVEEKTQLAAEGFKEAGKQRELVIALTKKIDAVSKRNKALEKEATRAELARAELVTLAVQTDEDAALLAARAAAEEARQSLSRAEAALAREAEERRTEAAAAERRLAALREEGGAAVAALEERLAAAEAAREREREGAAAAAAAAESALQSEREARATAQEAAAAAERRSGPLEAQLLEAQRRIESVEGDAIASSRALARATEESTSRDATLESLSRQLAASSEREAAPAAATPPGRAPCSGSVCPPLWCRRSWPPGWRG
uniref:Uncharacterized protein n=1 Tax=Emiliania huxleyi TaxID=2903 RepID=A0A7S3TUX1_EMIHU